MKQMDREAPFRSPDGNAQQRWPRHDTVNSQKPALRPPTAAALVRPGPLHRGRAPWQPILQPTRIEPLLKSGDFVAIVQPGIVINGTLSRRGAFPDIPLATEMLGGKVSGAAVRAFESWLKTVQIGKYYALPPNTPGPYLAAYRDAFEKMQADPDFRQQAKTALDPDYVMMSAAETKQLIDDLLAMSNEDLEFLNRLRNKYGLPSGDLVGR